MARVSRMLTDAKWEKISPLLPKLPQSRRGGRPWADSRSVLEGILWILRTGARWKDLPQRFPSASTCWRRLKRWEEEEVWLRIWRAFLSTLDERSQLDWSEAFIDASFSPAKKGGLRSERLRGGKAQSGWYWSTVRVFLLESTWSLLPQPKSNLLKPHFRRSAFLERDRVGRRRSRTGSSGTKRTTAIH